MGKPKSNAAAVTLNLRFEMSKLEALAFQEAIGSIGMTRQICDAVLDLVQKHQDAKGVTK
jgi:hypothetical protein